MRWLRRASRRSRMSRSDAGGRRAGFEPRLSCRAPPGQVADKRRGSPRRPSASGRSWLAQHLVRCSAGWRGPAVTRAEPPSIASTVPPGFCSPRRPVVGLGRAAAVGGRPVARQAPRRAVLQDLQGFQQARLSPFESPEHVDQRPEPMGSCTRASPARPLAGSGSPRVTRTTRLRSGSRPAGSPSSASLGGGVVSRPLPLVGEGCPEGGGGEGPPPPPTPPNERRGKWRHPRRGRGSPWGSTRPSP
jgi:hypothetical protein